MDLPIGMSRKLFHPPEHISLYIKIDSMRASEIKNLLLPDEIISRKDENAFLCES